MIITGTIIQEESCTGAVLGNMMKKHSKMYSQFLQGTTVIDVIYQVIKDLRLHIELKGLEDFLISLDKI